MRKRFALGNMPDFAARRAKEILDGETHMNFEVTLRPIPGNYRSVVISTDHPDTDVEILTFVIAVLVHELTGGTPKARPTVLAFGDEVDALPILDTEQRDTAREIVPDGGGA